MSMRLAEIASAIDGKLVGPDAEVSQFSIDSRKIEAGDVYIALRGERFDGHDFVSEVIKKGAAAVVTEFQIDQDVSNLVVKDTRLALAEIAAAWKQKLSLKTIAITGSNGKTSVKEMIAAVLAEQASVLFTQGNLNNDIGVPLTLLRLEEQHEFAVIEMGANHQAEIAYSCRFAKPDIGLITNIGAAHIEGFGSLDGVAKAKSEIVQSLGENGIAILNRDDNYFDFLKNRSSAQRIVSFGFHDDADIRAENIKVRQENKSIRTCFQLVSDKQSITINMKLAGQHNVMNVLAAAACAKALGIDLSQVRDALEKMVGVPGRMQFMHGKLGNIVINDTYNANPDSFQAALDVLAECEGEPWVVLGALGEMGEHSLKIHQDLGTVIKSKNVVRLLAVGSDAEAASRSFGVGATFFESQAQMIDQLNKELKGHETLLIKGSRAQKMENIVTAITQQQTG